jgi:hypothetical protein
LLGNVFGLQCRHRSGTRRMLNGWLPYLTSEWMVLLCLLVLGQGQSDPQFTGTRVIRLGLSG